MIKKSHENAHEKNVYKMSAILLKPQFIKATTAKSTKLCATASLCGISKKNTNAENVFMRIPSFVVSHAIVHFGACVGQPAIGHGVVICVCLYGDVWV